MDFKSSDIFKRALLKVQLIIVLLLAGEGLCWWLISKWITFYYAFWVMVGLVIFGVLLYPKSGTMMSGLTTSARKQIAALFALPLWLVKPLILVFAISPLRRLLIGYVTQKIINTGMRAMFGEDGLSGNPFGGFMQTGSDLSGHSPDEFIDAEHEILEDRTTATVDHRYDVGSRFDDMDEVIDVKHKWQD